VHKESIVVTVLHAGADRVLERRTLPNRPAAVEQLAQRVGSPTTVFVYEAGPCGYELHRQLTALGQRVVVVAPTLTPIRPGDRVKTDRRDAEKLARLYRAGELTSIRVPSREEEAARDLVRLREDILEDRLRAHHRLAKFLLRQGRVYRETKVWGIAHRRWLRAQRFAWEPLQQTFDAYLQTLEETEARLTTAHQQIHDLTQRDPYWLPARYLRCLKGIDTLSALTLVAETQDFRRFAHAPTDMGRTGLVSTERSTGARVWRGGITKAGNAHLRRILVEAAWCYRTRSQLNPDLAERRKGCPAAVVQVARKAQDRLQRKFWRMVSRGKLPQVAAVAVARELAGFVWAIAQHFPD
jgi:transposase